MQKACMKKQASRSRGPRGCDRRVRTEDAMDVCVQDASGCDGRILTMYMLCWRVKKRIYASTGWVEG
jgi:hypothetical protein